MKLIEIQGHNPHFIDLGRINDDSIIVDAGAMLGIFEENLRVTPQGKLCRIIILECDKSLKQLLEDKHIHNTTVIGRALCGQQSPSKKLFYQFIRLPGWGSFFCIKMNRVAKKKCKKILNYVIRTIRINDIFFELRIERIDYFKIDIMGAEREVIETMSQETASKIKQIDIKFYEMITGLDSKEGEKKLIDLGFVTKFVSERQVYGRRE